MSLLSIAPRLSERALPLPFEEEVFRPSLDIKRNAGPIGSLEQALAALQEAQRVIRSQDERISALENARATDELTGLSNRQGFLSALRRELAIARRTEKTAGLLLLADLDDFTQINDLYGHDTGDVCLQTVASLLINEVRVSDAVARLESDSFALLLPGLCVKAAGKRMEELEKRLNGRVMHNRAHAIPLRMSFGYAVLHETETPESLLMSADKKLFISKSRRKIGMKG
jgi:diguanylate cyclase (GGDEF)-like protein